MQTRFPFFFLCAALLLSSAWSPCNPSPGEDLDDDSDPIGSAGSDTGNSNPKIVTGGGTVTALTVDVPAEYQQSITELGDAATASAAVDQLVKQGPKVCDLMKDVARLDEDMTRRGRAVEVLARIPDDCSLSALQDIERYRGAPELVRTWAAAGIINRSKTMDELAAAADLVNRYPAVTRPLEMRATDLMDPGAGTDELLLLSMRIPKLQGALNNVLAKKPPAELTRSMLHHSDMEARRQAAALLGGAIGADASRQSAVANEYDFDPKATKVLWDGGPLYVPGVSWQKEPARELITNLISWYLFCDLKGNNEGRQQVYNNLRSIGLLNPAGFSWMDMDLISMLTQYKSVMGEPALRDLLSEQGVAGDARFSGLLSKKVTR